MTFRLTVLASVLALSATSSVVAEIDKCTDLVVRTQPLPAGPRAWPNGGANVHLLGLRSEALADPLSDRLTSPPRTPDGRSRSIERIPLPPVGDEGPPEPRWIGVAAGFYEWCDQPVEIIGRADVIVDGQLMASVNITNDKWVTESIMVDDVGAPPARTLCVQLDARAFPNGRNEGAEDLLDLRCVGIGR